LDIEGTTLEEQASLLAEVTQHFACSLDIAETLANAIHRFVEYLDAEAASIFLLEEDGTVLVCRECAGPVNIRGLRIPADRGIVGRTVQTGTCQMIRDARTHPDFSGAVDAQTGFVTRSILCTPLLIHGKAIGALELINKRGVEGLFDNRDRHLLTAIASSAALAIHNARMAVALVEQERMRRELELARHIQEGLLPDGGGTDMPVMGMNLPAREVSGDFYDFFRLQSGKIYFNLADVSGKGMNAALLMAKTSSLLRCLAKSIDDPGLLLQRVNEELCETSSRGMFVTVVSGFVDSDSGTVELANAGHPPALFHMATGEFVEIEAEAPPLGVEIGLDFPTTRIQLNGGRLYLFSDGVTETRGADNRFLDVRGLIQLIGQTSAPTLCQRLHNIVAQIRTLSPIQHDDITMMLIEHQARG